MLLTLLMVSEAHEMSILDRWLPILISGEYLITLNELFEKGERDNDMFSLYSTEWNNKKY